LTLSPTFRSDTAGDPIWSSPEQLLQTGFGASGPGRGTQFPLDALFRSSMCIPTAAPFLPTPFNAAFNAAPKYGLPLQTLTLLDLFRSTHYAQNMELYARVMSIAASGERQSARGQVEWIQTYLSTQRCFSCILNGVEEMVNQACLLPHSSVASCAARLILGSELKLAIPTLGQDMYRLSAMNGFPTNQVKLISGILREVGVTIENQVALRRCAEQEQLLVQEKIAQYT
jgi:hypothetical protein